MDLLICSNTACTNSELLHTRVCFSGISSSQATLYSFCCKCSWCKNSKRVIFRQYWWF